MILISGCGKTASQKLGEKMTERSLEKTIEKQSGGKADIDINGGNSTITTDQGTISTSQTGQAKLPDDFSKDIFVYDDAKIAYSSSYAGPPKMISVNYYTSSEPEQVFEKYKTMMEKDNWTKTDEVNMGSQNLMLLNYQKNNDERIVMISIAVETNAPETRKTIVGINETIK